MPIDTAIVSDSPTQNNSNVGFVYLIRVKGHKVYKIGYSTCPSRRLKTLQSKTRLQLEIVAQILYAHVTTMEIVWQEEYKQYKLSGEWFVLPDGEVERFKSLAVQ